MFAIRSRLQIDSIFCTHLLQNSSVAAALTHFRPHFSSPFKCALCRAVVKRCQLSLIATTSDDLFSEQGVGLANLLHAPFMNGDHILTDRMLGKARRGQSLLFRDPPVPSLLFFGHPPKGWTGSIEAPSFSSAHADSKVSCLGHLRALGLYWSTKSMCQRNRDKKRKLWFMCYCQCAQSANSRFHTIGRSNCASLNGAAARRC